MNRPHIIIRPVSSTTKIDLEITLFSVWHFLYIFLILGAIFLGAYLLKNKSKEIRRGVLSTISTLIVVTYLGDFFVHPFVYGEMNIDKLPFHICTVLCPIIAFTQFNKKFEKLKEPVTVLAIVAPLMYITYPGSALGGVSPWDYVVVQTFLYHGLVLAWGVLRLTTQETEFAYKNVWQALIMICCIALWAGLGNVIYNNFTDHHFDWFFLTGSTFPFVPTPLMPLAVIAAVFGMVNIIYGIYYGVKRYLNKKVELNEALKTA